MNERKEESQETGRERRELRDRGREGDGGSTSGTWLNIE